ncbi:phosphoenolpyruvate--protein phosphotransferase [Extibacter sp. GGCC_0201]|uniref:phosphoenolpyruvate--protein phosphotransferase n=1 Tax=Extibacter sp. GGCC_0201 TaxID=2731209 RepID=UPI001AA10823|nr:phosphoenolpyruvate--protein phosphotransferase [Extibacter sp. GGCC_0201]MBO1719716.1 phosphoenolpyruvate--protein phosphotransferase [Extibacter sp. GGCC_0201]
MTYQGNGISEGIANGRIYRYLPAEIHITRQSVSKSEAGQNLEKFQRLRRTAMQELLQMEHKLQTTDPGKAKIFAAHQEMLEDEELQESISNAIEECYSLDWAIESSFSQFITLLSKAKDPLISARTADLEDVKNRLLRLVAGVPERNLAELPPDTIVVAYELLPSDTAVIDREHVKGIITEIGGVTSHTAIIARSYGIPAVSGVTDALECFQDGGEIIINALSGEVIYAPTQEELLEAAHLKNEYMKEKEVSKQFLVRPCQTSDHVSVKTGINIGALEEEESLLPYVDYIGLFRTEFIYMDSGHMPTEEEQYEAYRHILEKARGKTVVLRTLDIGGDKVLPYLELPKEENPFLGNRALRFCLEHEELFITQLRAALRASVYGDLWVMFPMIGSIGDIRSALTAFEAAKRSLEKDRLPFDDGTKVGIMIEIPAIALLAEEAARQVDFASIGTNDLLQYLTAADRQNAQVIKYYNAGIPAVLRLIDYVNQIFTEQGKTVSVCGEMGGDPVYAPIFAGMGIRKLSMGMSRITAVKQAMSCFSAEELCAIKDCVLEMDSTEQIVSFMKAEIAGKRDK